MTAEIIANVESVDAVRRTLTVTVPVERVDEAFEAAYRQARRSAAQPGYRKGHVPLHLIKQLYGAEIKQEVAERLINESFHEAIEKSGLAPVATPGVKEFDLAEGQPLTFSAELEVRPEFPLPAYKGLALTKKIDPVSDEDVAKVLEDLSLQTAPVRNVLEDRGARDGDVALVDFAGLRGGNAVPGLAAQDYNLEIGGGGLVPGFEEALRGMKPEQTKEFTTTFPDEFSNPELAGAEVVFKVTLKALKERVPQPIDDDFARDLGEYQNLGELKEKVRTDMTAVREREAKTDIKNQIVEKLMEQAQFELPPSLVADEENSIVRDVARRMAVRRMPVEEARKQIEAARSDIQTAAGRNVKVSMILEAIAKAEQISVQKEDIDAAVKSLADQQKKPLPEMRKELIKTGAMEGVQRIILEEKALDCILQQATVTEEAVQKQG